MAQYRRRLPHWHPEGTCIFLTWRLWGSLPRSEELLTCRTSGQRFVARDRILDLAASGPIWLKEFGLAKLVSDAIQQGGNERHFYDLCAWVVMPNHVHLLALPQVPVSRLTRWLKGSTARSANELLGRAGQRFWQDESYDHWVRDSTEHNRIVRYIE